MKINPEQKQKKQLIRKCVVCTKEIRPEEKQFREYYGGMNYPVCCPSCGAKFKAAPREYMDGI